MLKEKNNEITLEIQLITEWIREHRARRPLRTEAPMPNEHVALQSWRKVSYRLHQRRSELKMNLEKIQMHLRAATQKIEEMETEFFYFSIFPVIGLEPEMSSADA